MQVKIHRSYRNVVAIADSDLIGKKFEDGKFQLDVRENFYKDRELGKKDMIRLMQIQKVEDSTFNIVGPESVKAALEAGIVSESSVGKIAGIPFALTFM